MNRDLQRWLDPDWRDRLVAWWEGYDIPSLQRAARAARRARHAARTAGAAEPVGIAAPAAAPPPEPPPDPFAAARALEDRQLDRHGYPVWSIDRTRGAEMLWGDGMTGPADGAFMVDAVRPFGLSPAKSVLDLAAGLGGPGRAIVSAYDTWVTGLEASPVLARLGADKAAALGMQRKCPISHYDPERLSQAGSFDLVLGDRILHRVRDKQQFLDHIRACTKPRGGLLLFDYTIDGTPTSWDDWNGWRETEPQEVYPWTGQRIVDELTQRNLDLRVAEDVTARHRLLVLERLRHLTEALQAGPPDGGMLAGLARELTLWWARLRVLGHGLTLTRFVANRLA